MNDNNIKNAFKAGIWYTISTLLVKSISIISTQSLEKETLHASHSSQAIPFFGFKQLIFLAKIFDTEVFPVPLGPKNIYACEKFL